MMESLKFFLILGLIFHTNTESVAGQQYNITVIDNTTQSTTSSNLDPNTPTYTTASTLIADDCVNYEDCLFKDLFSRYNKYVRPVKDPRRAVNLTVTLVLNSLMDIKEREENMIVVGFLRTFWYDEFLTWDPDKYGGVTHLIIPAERIWLPDLAISNSASHFYDISHKRDFHVEIESDGRIRWAFGGIFTSNCHIDLKDYPFDSQSCSIEIENWMYVIQDVSLGFNDGDKVAVTSLGPSAVWYLHGTNATRLVKYDRFASLKFTLIWKRKTLYYYVNIVIPIVLMLVVAMGVFWLPAECGEKMSLAITIVLAFSVFQIIIMENTPVNSDVVPGITALVLLVTVTATTSLLTSMLVVYISGKSTNRRPPAWVRTICFKYIATVLFLRRGVPKKKDEAGKDKKPTVMTDMNGYHANGTHDSTVGINSIKTPEIKYRGHRNYEQMTSPNHHNHHSSIFQTQLEPENGHNTSMISSDIASIRNMLQDIKGIVEEKDDSDFVRDEWRYVGVVVDRLAFWVTFVVLVTSLAYIWNA